MCLVCEFGFPEERPQGHQCMQVSAGSGASSVQEEVDRLVNVLAWVPDS